MDVYISSRGSQKGPYSLEQIRQMQERHEILPTDYAWYAGLPAWVPIAQLQPDGSIGPPPIDQKATIKHRTAAAFDGITGRITSIAGVEKIEGLHRKDFFSETFKKRTDDEIDELFTTGTKATTPPLKTIDTRWPHPWLFLRAAIVAVLLYVAFYVGLAHFGNPNFLPGLMLVGSFAIPLATLILFVEMNVPRNMSLYQTFKLVNAGGIVALIFTVALWVPVRYFGPKVLPSLLDASLTGFIEEAAKIGAVVLLMRNKRFHWTLNGLLIGAAVGTGFAAFESAGYAFNQGLIEPVRSLFVPRLMELLKHLPQGVTWDALQQGVRTGLAQLFWDQGVSAMVHVITTRGVLAPLGHIVWTAIAAAALWKVKGDQLFDWRMLGDWRFLRVFFLVVACHALWDLQWINNDIWAYTKYLILGFVAWVAALAYVQEGLKQIRQAQQASGASDTGGAAVSPA
jgi:protease PrsW